MRGIEVEDRLGQNALPAEFEAFVAKRRLERAQQPIAERCPFGDDPRAECRIDVLEPGQQLAAKAGQFEQERMHLPRIRRTDHGPNIDVDRRGLEADLAGIHVEAVKSSLVEQTAQFPDHLAQHGAGLRFAGFAPQQPHQPLARFAQRLAQRDVSEHGPQLQALGPDLPLAEFKDDRTEQGKPQNLAGIGHRAGGEPA